MVCPEVSTKFCERHAKLLWPWSEAATPHAARVARAPFPEIAIATHFVFALRGFWSFGLCRPTFHAYFATPEDKVPIDYRSSCILQRLMFQALTLRKGLQGRLITYQPDMAEGVEEPPLPVDTPGSFVVLHTGHAFCSLDL
jgi:hypothetical protein